MKIEYGIQHQFDGCVVRRVIDNGRPMYVEKVNRGNYTFVRFFIQAKHFAKETAMKHILVLASRDMTGKDDELTVTIERRN